MTNDPLDKLLKLSVDEVLELIKSSMNDYIEDEGYSKGVSKIKAMEDFTLWYYGDKEKELALREIVNNI